MKKIKEKQLRGGWLATVDGKNAMEDMIQQNNTEPLQQNIEINLKFHTSLSCTGDILPTHPMTDMHARNLLEHLRSKRVVGRRRKLKKDQL